MGIKVGMVSLGCPKNQVDAEMMLATLKGANFEITADPGLADVVVVNTCGFIESAKAESIENILEFCGLKKEGRIKCVVVTGCLAERYRDQVGQEIPEADVVLSIGRNQDIARVILEAMAKDEPVYAFGDKYSLPLEGERMLSTPPYMAYLKIAEGCDNRCTYCAIPMIRGGFRSRRMEDVLAEAKNLAGQGVREVVLIAQDTSRYGEDLYGESLLPILLEELAKIQEFRWIRVLYCYPERITDALLDTIADHGNIAKYLDLPLQHCNGRILKLMNRHGDKKTLLALLQKIRGRIPGITLRTSLIAGFPSETDEEFEELCQFVKEAKFDRLGCFAYSAEEDTPAARLPGQLDEALKQRRAELVMELQYEVNLGQAERKIGRTIPVVVEGYDRYAECFFGRSEADAPEIDFKVFFTSGHPLSLGEMVMVRIGDQLDLDLTGEVVLE